MPVVTDDAARDREQWPGGGRVQGEPGRPPGDVPAGSLPDYWPPYADQPISGSPQDHPPAVDEYGLEVRPVSGGYPEQPVSGGYPAQPVSGGYAAHPVSGGHAVQPVSGGYPPAQRRIEPSPPPQRGKLVLGLVAGLVAGALLGGTGAFFLGRASAGDDPAPVVVQQPAAVAALTEANRAKFSGELATLAEPWLADMSNCLANTDSGGPKLDTGQRTHVLCRDGGMYLHFVAYESADAKATDLGYRQQIALNSASILAGAEQPGRKLGGLTGAPGTYVEYATRSGTDPALCGVWWNRDNTDAAVYVDVLCDSLGGTWDPLRAVWQRHS